MASISNNYSSIKFTGRDVGTYFPAIPPKTPKAATSYSRSLHEAPRSALAGVIVDGRQPERHPVMLRHRVRKAVGLSNRWRLPESLGSDLLGSSQAMRAISFHLNDSMIHIISAENPHLSLNQDPAYPYKFKAVGVIRPTTCPESTPREAYSEKPVVEKRVTVKEESKPKKPQLTLRPATISPHPSKIPQEIFQYHAKEANTAPDVLLQCLGTNWELHRPMLQKADTLAELLEHADQPGPKQYYKTKVAEPLDDLVMRSAFYNAHKQEISSHVKTVDGVEEEVAENVDESQTSKGSQAKTLAHPKHISVKKINNMTVISLKDVDPLVTKHALAVALGNLYHDELQVAPQDVVGVLAAAHALRFHALIKGCSTLMTRSLCSRTICSYYTAAVKLHQDQLQEACERWLELNLVAELGCRVELRELPIHLLQKILHAIRLFTPNEFSLYKELAFWTFFQLNPEVQIMPSYTSVVTYFNSLPKAQSLLEREEGQAFLSLFMSLRLHGIIDTNHLMDVQTMNIVPQAWIVKVLAQLYYSLQGGGDMSLMTNFQTGGIRQGFVIMEEPHYHSEIFSLHGFHFELRGARGSQPGTYSFFMQRLKPQDPVLSFRQCERSTFSMRPEREVQYCIRVQAYDSVHQAHMYTTGVLQQRFGLGTKTAKSKVLTLENLRPPIYVSFSFLFPPS